MFTITYVGGARVTDISTKRRLHDAIMHASQDIEAVYEQATPINHRVRKELAPVIEHGTAAARRFISSRP